MKQWLTAVRAWLQEAISSPLYWGYMGDCLKVLHAKGRFPSFIALRNLVKEHRVEFEVDYLSRLLNNFLSDENNCQSRLNYFALFRDCHISPEEILERNLVEVRDCFSQTASILALERGSDSEWLKNLAFVTMPWNDSASLPRNLTVDAEIDESDPPYAAPRIHETFRLGFSPLDLVPPWMLTEDILAGDGVEFTNIVRRLSLSLSPDPADFRLGPEFWRYLTASTIHTNDIALSKLVRVSAHLVAGRILETKCDLRQIRQSEGANSPQKIRSSDDARAWRLTVMEHGAGWRMNYWHIPEGRVRYEFSVVERKSKKVTIV